MRGRRASGLSINLESAKVPSSITPPTPIQRPERKPAGRRSSMSLLKKKAKAVMAKKQSAAGPSSRRSAASRRESLMRLGRRRSTAAPETSAKAGGTSASPTPMKLSVSSRDGSPMQRDGSGGEHGDGSGSTGLFFDDGHDTLHDEFQHFAVSSFDARQYARDKFETESLETIGNLTSNLTAQKEDVVEKLRIEAGRQYDEFVDAATASKSFKSLVSTLRDSLHQSQALEKRFQGTQYQTATSLTSNSENTLRGGSGDGNSAADGAAKSNEAVWIRSGSGCAGITKASRDWLLSLAAADPRSASRSAAAPAVAIAASGALRRSAPSCVICGPIETATCGVGGGAAATQLRGGGSALAAAAAAVGARSDDSDIETVSLLFHSSND